MGTTTVFYVKVLLDFDDGSDSHIIELSYKINNENIMQTDSFKKVFDEVYNYFVELQRDDVETFYRSKPVNYRIEEVKAVAYYTEPKLIN